MRTMSWILVSGLVAASLGCQRAEKPTAEKAPAAEAPSTVEPAEENAHEAEPAKVDVATQVEPANVTSPVTDAKTAAAEVEPAAPLTVAHAQPSASKSAQPSNQQASASGNNLSKAEIINSSQFRQAIFEFNEWLTSQPIYTPQQVAQIKNQFNHRVAEMNAEQLTYLLNDLEAKMQLINTPDAREARAWMAQYLSVMSDRKREDVLKDVPNVATMTAAQLADELSKIQEKRATMDNEQAAFQKGQAAQVAQQVQTDRINQQNFVRDWNTGPTSYSPYASNGSNVNQRLNDTPIGTGLSFYTGAFGGVGIAFSPSAW